MTSNEEADWNKAHEVDSQTGRPTKELYTDNDPATTIKGKGSFTNYIDSKGGGGFTK